MLLMWLHIFFKVGKEETAKTGIQNQNKSAKKDIYRNQKNKTENQKEFVSYNESENKQKKNEEDKSKDNGSGNTGSGINLNLNQDKDDGFEKY
ncbi:MAG: hypothetical protein ACOC8S_02685 [Bacteroidota bacterium]